MEDVNLQTFISNRLAVLSKEEAEISERLRRIRHEREGLRKSAAAAGVEIESHRSQNERFEKRPPTRLKDQTIKEAVIEVLRAYPDGLTALEILQKINSKSGVTFSRASLSPQLSRLKHEKRILADSGIWALKNKSESSSSVQPEFSYPQKENKKEDQ